jgi:L-ascorbate metabolism protein UlaG (beta-lactamase superfamily)
MHLQSSFIFFIGVSIAMIMTSASARDSTHTEIIPQAHKRDGRFHNIEQRGAPGVAKSLAIAWRYMTEKSASTVPLKPIAIKAVTSKMLIEAPDESLYRFGHSTLLMKLGGEFWLTDPVFSERASPVQWAGPKRFHAPPISIEDLPLIKGVILSHDHFDHLDRVAIVKLAPKVETFLTPLGVGDRLIEWGVNPGKVRQLDWWQSTSVQGVKFAAVPAQHFSGRGLGDGNKTLWASWVIHSGDLKLFFSGDTGYHAGFKLIGEQYGPFDLTMLETGAYDPGWPDVHMQPEETLQAHIDLKGRWLLPVHNGTFDLALHAWHEPFDRIHALAQSNGIALSTPAMGERLSLRHPTKGRRWWIQAEPAHARGSVIETTLQVER